MQCYIRAGSLTGYQSLVRSYSVNPQELLKQAGILNSQLRDPDTFIDYQAYLMALNLAQDACQDESFGLKLSLKQGLSTMGLIGAYMSRQESIEKALQIAMHYMYLHVEGLLLHVQSFENHISEIQFTSISEEVESAVKSQLAIGTCFQILQHLAGGPIKLDKVSLRQIPTFEQQSYFTHFFNAPVEFGADIDALYFPSSLLKIKPKVYDGMIDEIIKNHLEQNRSQHQTDYLTLIRSSMKLLLASGECSQQNLAQCLGIHPKKMQRLLAAEKTNYRQLLDDVRRFEALRLLKQEGTSLTTIALKLGYSELAIFSRKFKHWYGVSPAHWRKSQI
ncbi:MAG: AraC family transcriptional regulator ligand-binding domain-containing protein [Vibrio sp.]